MIDYLYLSLYKLFALLVKILPKMAMDTLLYMIANLHIDLVENIIIL